MRHDRLRTAINIVGLALAVVTSLLLVSQRLDGPVSAVAVKGNSMEPAISAGDLVVVAKSGRYEAGDAVAYRSGKLDAIVLHRIVERDGDRFVFKGDNNGWLDPERPARDLFVGK